MWVITTDGEYIDCKKYNRFKQTRNPENGSSIQAYMDETPGPVIAVVPPSDRHDYIYAAIRDELAQTIEKKENLSDLEAAYKLASLSDEGLSIYYLFDNHDPLLLPAVLRLSLLDKLLDLTGRAGLSHAEPSAVTEHRVHALRRLIEEASHEQVSGDESV